MKKSILGIFAKAIYPHYAPSLLLACILFAGCSKQDLLPGRNQAVVQQPNSSNLSTGRPNVILILIDDFGYEIPTVNGGQSYATPNMDQMAAEGMRFTQCHGSPLCSPARFMFLTGKYNFRNYTNWGVMDRNQRTLGNLFQMAGYATCAAGKWQLDGGDSSAKAFGFEKYSLWNAYEIFTSGTQGSPYKNPQVFQDGAFLPEQQTLGLYGDDVFTDYINTFIDSNRNNNFFVYYAPTAVHSPFGPTPDDPEFATWDPKAKISDARFFPSMVRHLDWNIGRIISKLKETGLYNNTIVAVTGDNGTPKEIVSLFNGALFQGGKGSTKEAGVHVPLFITWPNYIAPGTVNGNLVDFPDFMNTFAEMTATDISSFGQTDGVSFYRQLTNELYTPRSYSYDYYHPLTNKGNTTLRPWIQDSVYKLYHLSGNFFNIKEDPLELKKIKQGVMNTEQKASFNRFKSLVNTYPSVATP